MNYQLFIIKTLKQLKNIRIPLKSLKYIDLFKNIILLIPDILCNFVNYSKVLLTSAAFGHLLSLTSKVNSKQPTCI